MIIYQDIYTIFLRTRLLVILKIKLRKIIFYIFKLEVACGFKCYGCGTMRVGCFVQSGQREAGCKRI